VDEAERIHLIILIGGTATLVPHYELSESKTSFEFTFREPWNSSKKFPVREERDWGNAPYRLLKNTHLLRFAANLIARRISIYDSLFGFCTPCI
jgi:hypothetical protein